MNNNYFEKHLRTAASDYSFTFVIYLFSAVSLQFTRKTMIFHGEENVICNITVTKLVTILIKCFFPHLNPTSYHNKSGWIWIDYSQLLWLLWEKILEWFWVVLLETHKQFRSSPPEVFLRKRCSENMMVKKMSFVI